MTLPRGQLHRPPCIAAICNLKFGVEHIDLYVHANDFSYLSKLFPVVQFYISNLTDSIVKIQPSMVHQTPKYIHSNQLIQNKKRTNGSQYRKVNVYTHFSFIASSFQQQHIPILHFCQTICYNSTRRPPAHYYKIIFVE